MKILSLDAIVFDFDGVLAESVDVKGEAFVALYETESVEIRAQVRAYHDENGGVSRFDKIRFFENVLLDRAVSDARVMELADKFSGIVEQRVIDAPWVDGARDFLDSMKGEKPLYVASATPQEELRRIVQKRGMAHYFRDVLGSPDKKDVLLGRIIVDGGFDPSRVLMIGDAITDYNAAMANGTAFVGRVMPGLVSPFPAGVYEVADLAGLARFIDA